MGENGGPSGCLQYFTAAAGLVSSYNYPIGAAAVVNVVTGGANNFQHLNNQNYAICFRRAAGNCALCFSPDVRTGAADQSFGLSISATAALGIYKNCGAIFVATDNTIGATTTTVCTGDLPFRIRFVTDAIEMNTGNAGTTSDLANKGSVGFSLDYWQAACT